MCFLRQQRTKKVSKISTCSKDKDGNGRYRGLFAWNVHITVGQRGPKSHREPQRATGDQTRQEVLLLRPPPQTMPMHYTTETLFCLRCMHVPSTHRACIHTYILDVTRTSTRASGSGSRRWVDLGLGSWTTEWDWGRTVAELLEAEILSAYHEVRWMGWF